MAVHLREDKITTVLRLANLCTQGGVGDWASIFAHGEIVFNSLLPNGNDVESCTELNYGDNGPAPAD